jgi:hypothetical protein
MPTIAEYYDYSVLANATYIELDDFISENRVREQLFLILVGIAL